MVVEAQQVDVIGDVHGCFDELIELIDKMGYEKGDGLYHHPEGRILAFVGDITDRGPQNLACLDFVYRHHQAGLCEAVLGNHDSKLWRTLKGNPTKVGHGLQATLDELEDVSNDQKETYWKWLRDLPLVNYLDDGNLAVVHAAYPFDGAHKKSTALYGYTTGNRTEDGFPERLNWAPAYSHQASQNDPYVVYGHVTHKDPYITKKTACVDTGCFSGNKLVALRWPSKELVEVPSQQEDTGRDLVEPPEGEDHPTPVMRLVKPEPIADMSLPYLLGKLKKNERDMLYLIDTDEDLKTRRRQDDGLIIANASKGLFEPEYEHQLLAKGIVYDKNPYRLVSLPLVKMHNHGMREFSDDVSQRYEQMSDVDLRFIEKMDGTMIQLFRSGDEVVFTTRSIMEGVDTSYFDEESFDYIGAARQLAKKKYPRLLDPEFLCGLTLVFELIHPEARVVTDYGDRQELTLLSVFDLDTFSYWAYPTVRDFAEDHGLDYCKTFLTANCLDTGVEQVRSALEDRSDVPEGAIVNFEQNGDVVHRVKVKTMDYLKYHRLKFHCTYKTVVELIWNKPELHDWNTFLSHLRENQLTEEEVESFYRDHFDQFMEYMDEVRDKRQRIVDIVDDFTDRFIEDEGDDKVGEGEYYKQLAMWARDEFSQSEFGMIMTYARNGKLDLSEDVMWSDPPCNGFKAIVARAKEGNEKITIDDMGIDLEFE